MIFSNVSENPNPPFYVGEVIVAVDALPGAFIKNGRTYRVVWCDKYFCNDQWFWGVRVHVDSDWTLAPRIFRSMAKFNKMIFEKLNQQQPICAN